MTDQCTNFTKELLMTEMADLPFEDRLILIEHNSNVMFTFKTASQFGEVGTGTYSEP